MSLDTSTEGPGPTDSDCGPVDGNFGTWSSMEDGVVGEVTPTNDEVVRVSVSGDLDCSGETGENHFREDGIGTESDWGGGLLSTLVSSGFGGVGGMMFVTGS